MKTDRETMDRSAGSSAVRTWAAALWPALVLVAYAASVAFRFLAARGA